MQTMGDFTNMSERLSLMPDTALQQFAQMHRDDPFTLALAVSESNRRKKLRAAQQGQAGAQPQPPVADQEIAQMNAPVMPENVGIGALAAPNMQMPGGGITGEEEEQAPAMMAGGGMVAFAGGGDVERYDMGGSTSALHQFLRATGQASAYVNGTPAEKAAIEAVFRATVQGPSPAAAAAAAATPTTATPAAAARPLMSPGVLGSAARVAPIAGIPIGIAAGLTSGLESMQAQGYPGDPAGEFTTGALTPEQAAFDADRVKKLQAQRADAARVSALIEGRTPASNPAEPITGENLRRDSLPAQRQILAGPGAGPGAERPVAAPRPVAPVGPKSVLDVFNEARRTALTEPNPFEAQGKDIAAEELALAKDAAARVRADSEKFADAFKGREERLEKRVEELAKSKDTNTGLAFLNAGLAIMSTPGGLATAIGKGARVGTEQYAAGLDKLRAAQERLDDAKDRIEELKLNRAEMSAKEIREAELGIKRTVVQGKKDLLAGAKTWYGDQTKLASEIAKVTVGAQEGALDRASRERVAAASTQAALNSPDRIAFLAALKNTVTKDKPQGDPVEAYRKLMEVKREPMTLEKLRADWNDLSKRAQISADYPNVKTFEDYALVMGAGGGGGGFSLVGTRPAQ